MIRVHLSRDRNKTDTLGQTYYACVMLHGQIESLIPSRAKGLEPYKVADKAGGKLFKYLFKPLVVVVIHMLTIIVIQLLDKLTRL